MASYLESYGAVENQRARRIRLLKWVSIGVVCALFVGAVAYALFKNLGEEQQVKGFLVHLRNQEYQDAYRMWGCTEATPCRDYAFPKFMEDWGPNTPHANTAAAKISMSQSCGTGVLIRLDYPHAEPVTLWVERSTKVIGFAPWPECPGRHWHIGTFLRGLFGG
jgi:hypothetical protein